MGHGAGDRPLTYSGAWDTTLTYLPREVVTDGGQVYLATATSTGAAPATNPSSWLHLGGGSGGSIYLDTVIKQGPAGVATDVFPAGTRVPFACTTTAFYARCNPSHTPSGSACTVLVKAGGSTIATISIAAGASTGSVSTAVALSAGDRLTYDITSVGSTTPAWDVAVGIEAA